MAGLMLVTMAYARLGRFIEYIPEPVTLGFTDGIGIVLATLQLKDFFGLSIREMPEHYPDKVWLLIRSLSQFDGTSLLVAAVTLCIMLYWPKLKTPIPQHLPAIILASVLSIVLLQAGYPVDTIGSRFTWPWQQPGPGGRPLEFSWALLINLLPSAFGIAILGAIESLLCAVVLDGSITDCRCMEHERSA